MSFQTITDNKLLILLAKSYVIGLEILLHYWQVPT